MSFSSNRKVKERQIYINFSSTVKTIYTLVQDDAAIMALTSSMIEKSCSISWSSSETSLQVPSDNFSKSMVAKLENIKQMKMLSLMRTQAEMNGKRFCLLFVYFYERLCACGIVNVVSQTYLW